LSTNNSPHDPGEGSLSLVSSRPLTFSFEHKKMAESERERRDHQDWGSPSLDLDFDHYPH
jgi:hypothetical protein